MQTPRDEVYKKRQSNIESFCFDQKVAEVFDNMVSRSVPFYHEIHRIILDIVNKTHLGNGLIYDLGCSTGTTITLIDKLLQKKGYRAQYIGIDNSPFMLKKCQEKLEWNKVNNYQLIRTNIEDVKLVKSKTIIMNYTLQFISPEKRPYVLKKIYDSLKKDGIFILSEKLKSSHKTIDNILTDLYYNFKRENGYSELEITQKREALENVLIPLTSEKQIELLNKAGFTKVETLFRWYNFACYLAIK